MSAAAGYDLVIGLEVHVQLKTRTKIFCPCATSFGGAPNANTCPVCLALPGALPVLNAHAVQLAARAALALGCTVHETSVFARKNYFYPDLPKGYQISQFDRPLATGGQLQLANAPSRLPRVVGITRLHLEEDAGKSVHDRFPGCTAIDLNRAGVPLAEIVSEPDLRSSAEAREYLLLLKEILQFADVSDANMEEGSLRVDANVSVRPAGARSLGTRTEIKNMNSFSAVERAIDVEFARQCALLDAGGTVVQQTMLWDAAANAVRRARSKEESHDYRYFPEPDLPVLHLSPAWIADTRAALPELPEARRARFQTTYGVNATDAAGLTATRALADYYERVAQRSGDGRGAASWVMTEVLAFLNFEGLGLEQLAAGPESVGDLLVMIREGAVSHNAAKKIFQKMARSGAAPAAAAQAAGLLQIRDDAPLEAWAEEVWSEHPDEAARLAAGEQKLLGVLVGLAMKKSRGRADPKKLNRIFCAKARLA